MNAVCRTCFLFHSVLLFVRRILGGRLRSYRGKKGVEEKREAVAKATGAAALVIMKLLLHCLCVCLWTQRVWVHPPLSRQEARTSPSNTVPTERGEREGATQRHTAQRAREGARDRNPIMHCTLQGWSRADSSVPVWRDRVWTHTHSYTHTECERNTQTNRQVRQLPSDRLDDSQFYEMMCLSVSYGRLTRGEGRLAPHWQQGVIIIWHAMIPTTSLPVANDWCCFFCLQLWDF